MKSLEVNIKAKEPYEKLEIRSQEVSPVAYGSTSPVFNPLQLLHPLFGFCCN